MNPTTTQAPITPPTPIAPNPYQVANVLPKATATFTPQSMPVTPTMDFGQFQDNPTGAATAFQGAQAQLSNNQQTARNDIFGQYQQAIQGFGSTADNYGQLATAYGIPAYQQAMSGLQKALSGLRDNVTARTQGYNVNEAQATKLYNQELVPLSQNLSDVSREYNIATGNIAELMKYQSQDQQMALKPIEAYLQSLDSTFANQNQVFGNAANMGLQGIESAMSNKLEKDRLNQAASQFAQTFGLEQLKNTQQVEQFAKTYGLEVDKFKETIQQFNKTFGLEGAKFNEDLQQNARQFELGKYTAGLQGAEFNEMLAQNQRAWDLANRPPKDANAGTDIQKYMDAISKMYGAGGASRPSLEQLQQTTARSLPIGGALFGALGTS